GDHIQIAVGSAGGDAHGVTSTNASGCTAPGGAGGYPDGGPGGNTSANGFTWCDPGGGGGASSRLGSSYAGPPVVAPGGGRAAYTHVGGFGGDLEGGWGAGDWTRATGGTQGLGGQPGTGVGGASYHASAGTPRSGGAGGFESDTIASNGGGGGGGGWWGGGG